MIEVELIGQIGFKKLREKESGKKYLHLSIADDKYINQHKSVTWYTVFVNGESRAEKFNFLEVGDLVLVKGDAQLNAQINQHTNEPIAYLSISADKIIRLKKRYNNEKSTPFTETSEMQGEIYRSIIKEENDNDDIPF